MGRWPEKSFDLLMLTLVAGMLDALAYLRGHAFIANMTGNTVLLGLGLLGHHRDQTLPSVVALGGFLAGSATAAFTLTRETVSRDAASELRAGMTLEFAALALVCAIWAGFRGGAHSLPAFSILAAGGCAMGMQSVAVRRLRISGVVTTFITGTMTTAVVEVVSRGNAPKDAGKSNPRLLACMFVTYVLAAASGALLYDRAYTVACFAPLAAAALVLFRQLRPL